MTTQTPSRSFYATAQSATVGSMVYVISAAPDGRLSCACKGFTYRQTCRHLKEIAAAPVAAPPAEHSTNCDLYGFTGDCAVCS